jgi:protein SCO1/2
MRAGFVIALVLLVTVVAAGVTLTAVRHAASEDQGLPTIRPAPEFTLTAQDGAQISLSDFRGRVAAVTFIYTYCTTKCPILTPLLSMVQDQLGSDFGTRIVFFSVTLDPVRDTPQTLRLYAEAYGANLAGWRFLTGSPDVVRALAEGYGVIALKNANGELDHSFLTSIVDRRGFLRVQYLGVQFDPTEFRRDLLSLTKEH